ncbi:putative membrane protein [Saccharothrix tamanrassetensis]|uniref:Putative membrane protein n=1 Tax=Saccharothrix tamanrassetensis TaxID=1051531 RepID=A0A841CQG6_9PSEU|nr:YibE/F family protein [Saccharothrix tamanrassetensis]MBB5959460.1 putative membrane protein [Saccharothrix tamanrassetensis]
MCTVHAKDLIAAHGHGHGRDTEPSSAPVRRLLLVLLLPLVLATVVGALVLYPFGHDQPTGADAGLTQVPVRGDVTAVARGGCGPDADQPGATGCVLVTVKMADGAATGREVRIPVPDQASSPTFAVGDAVVLSFGGGDPTSSQSYQLADFQRGVPMVLLVVLFVAAVLLLGRWRGLAALGALALSFVVLVLFVLPAILAGEDPLSVAVVGAGLIMFVVLYLTHGVSARTSAAVLGTLVSLALIGVLGVVFSAFGKLTGLDQDTANLVSLLGHGIDTRGLLLAGTIIGALGVLDDVTVTQTSAVWELRRANPSLGFRELYAAGSRIGRDHLSSVVNTLVMAYAGTALPLLLAFSLSGRDLGEILTAQQVAQEVVRTLVGSIGLVAAVPITTALAAFVAGREDVPRIEADEDLDDEPDDEAEDGWDDEPEPEPERWSRMTGDLRTGYDPAKGPWRRPV